MSEGFLDNPLLFKGQAPEPQDDNRLTPTLADDDEWTMLNDRGDENADGELAAMEGADYFAVQANVGEFITCRRGDEWKPVMLITPVNSLSPETGTGTYKKTKSNVDRSPVIEPVSPVNLTSASEASAPIRRPRQRKQTVTIKSKLSEALTEAFAELKAKLNSVEIEEVERRCLLAATLAEKEWADKFAVAATSQQEPSTNEVAMLKLIQELEESEKFYYDKLVELSTSRAAAAPCVRVPVSASKLQADLDAAIKQRDHVAEEFGTLENNYGDLFRRYEMLRAQSKTLRDNETNLKQEAESMAIKYGKTRTKLQEAGAAAQLMLEKANEEIARLHVARDTDNLALRMKVKQYGSQIASYEAAISAKEVENQELQQICGELLQKADLHE